MEYVRGKSLDALIPSAIYARKSTDQSGVSDEQRSVARQVQHAKSYAARKGWQVLDEHVNIDDGISGAEFANRPGFLRLMNADAARRSISFSYPAIPHRVVTIWDRVLVIARSCLRPRRRRLLW